LREWIGQCGLDVGVVAVGGVGGGDEGEQRARAQDKDRSVAVVVFLEAVGDEVSDPMPVSANRVLRIVAMVWRSLTSSAIPYVPVGAAAAAASAGLSVAESAV
jgi:hypothetical protein